MDAGLPTLEVVSTTHSFPDYLLGLGLFKVRNGVVKE